MSCTIPAIASAFVCTVLRRPAKRRRRRSSRYSFTSMAVGSSAYPLPAPGPNFHAGCLRLVAELLAVWCSPSATASRRSTSSYPPPATARTRPRHSSDPWLADTADPRRVFVSIFDAAGLDPVRIARHIHLMPTC
uniref:Uncharacterized protein n=1 Tax=Oryza nivara TaxID=4536 RepID=A0A0E0FUR0_ORYNI